MAVRFDIYPGWRAAYGRACDSIRALDRRAAFDPLLVPGGLTLRTISEAPIPGARLVRDWLAQETRCICEKCGASSACGRNWPGSPLGVRGTLCDACDNSYYRD